MRQNIVQKATSQLELYVPINDAKAAQAQSVDNLDAWATYHIGLFRSFPFQDMALCKTICTALAKYGL